MYDDLLRFIRKLYKTDEFIPLHAPVFAGEEKRHVLDCVESTFVSSVSDYVLKVEDKISEYTGAEYVVAVTNGTCALHLSLLAAGVTKDDEVLSQALTFVATANAISYTGAQPVFIDVDLDTMGMSPIALQNFLDSHCELKEEGTFNKSTGKRIRACVPMHTFGFPARIKEIKEICEAYKIVLIEDAAESFGSFVDNQHTGTFGEYACLSFNGNKVVTAGMGGAILVKDEKKAQWLKHISTTAKVPHLFEFYHDEVGYNYRMAGINASLLFGQLENINEILKVKREIARKYRNYCQEHGINYISEIEGTTVNYWLNTISFSSKENRDSFLDYSNKNGVMCRPMWRLMTELPYLQRAQHDGLENSRYLEERIVNLPSSYIPK
jgi:perosamine synthetase